MYDLVIRNARVHSFRDGIAQDASGIAVNAGRIAALDPPADAPADRVIDAGGQLLLPGFIDCHTHAVFAGNRMNEHAMKLAGASYEEIARAGGGIVSTVEAVRKATLEQLVAESLPRVNALSTEGVTTLEIKSGYGLSPDAEMNMLRAARALQNHAPLDITTTYLGAHTVPKGRDKDEYLREVIDTLPRLAEENLADAVDIFVERIAFDVDDMRTLFDAARPHGFRLKAHTDQLSNMGATRVAADEYGVLSCDHLEYAEDADVRAMANNGTVAVLLPGAFYFIRETKKPPLQLFRQHGVPIAIATDVNPGSSPVASLLAVMHMSCIFFGLTAEEALLGVTRHAARALGFEDRGMLALGLRADFALWDIPAPEFLLYQLGGLRAGKTFVEGTEA